MGENRVFGLEAFCFRL